MLYILLQSFQMPLDNKYLHIKIKQKTKDEKQNYPLKNTIVVGIRCLLNAQLTMSSYHLHLNEGNRNDKVSRDKCGTGVLKKKSLNRQIYCFSILLKGNSFSYTSIISIHTLSSTHLLLSITKCFQSCIKGQPDEQRVNQAGQPSVSYQENIFI